MTSATSRRPLPRRAMPASAATAHSPQAHASAVRPGPSRGGERRLRRTSRRPLPANHDLGRSTGSAFEMIDGFGVVRPTTSPGADRHRRPGSTSRGLRPRRHASRAPAQVMAWRRGANRPFGVALASCRLSAQTPGTFVIHWGTACAETVLGSRAGHGIVPGLHPPPLVQYKRSSFLQSLQSNPPPRRHRAAGRKRPPTRRFRPVPVACGTRSELGDAEVQRFLGHLVRDRKLVLAQVLRALLFLYRHAHRAPAGGPGPAAAGEGADNPRAGPTVTEAGPSARPLLPAGRTTWLGCCLYGSGLRLIECLTLRVKDVDLEC